MTGAIDMTIDTHLPATAKKHSGKRMKATSKAALGQAPGQASGKTASHGTAGGAPSPKTPARIQRKVA